MTRILTINPNSSAAVTKAIDAALAPLRRPGLPTLDVTDLPEGPPGIATQRDSDSVIMPLVTLVGRDDADAFVIACFSDPGLHAVREAAHPRPVFGIAESAILHALTRGERFGIIALSPASVKRQQRYVRQMGLDIRYAGSHPVDASAADTASPEIRDRLIQAAHTLVQHRGADTVILGCAGMAAHRPAIETAIGRPVIEPSQQAVASAIAALLLSAA